MQPSSSLMPHAVCWATAPGLIWTMVVTNFVTFLSYLTICLTLFYLTRHTGKVIARDWWWFTIGFALFIVACGLTHLLEVITTWVPVFWVDAATNIVTAVLSAAVAIMLVRRVTAIGFGINDYADRLSRTEAEKQQMLSSLLAAQKLEDWSRMSASITHEISNPVETIQNTLYLIHESDHATSEVKTLVRTAVEEAERVMTISRSTLAFFRHAQQPESTDLLAAAESVQVLLHSTLAKKGVRLEIFHQGDLVVQAYPGETRQALLNLVRNAMEASERAGSVVSLTLQGGAQGVEVVIEDHGTGIPADVLPRLFQFGISTKGESGNGMGLWTVRQILMKHGGTVDVTSKLGEGTRFRLWWPRVVSVEHTKQSANLPAFVYAES